MTTRISTIDAALVSVGAAPLMTESARGAANRIREFETLRSGLLSHPYFFSTRSRQLARLSGTAQIHWDYRYALPADMLGGPRAAYDQPDQKVPFFEYDLVAAQAAGQQAELVTNASEIWLKYTIDVMPQFWPGYFYQAFVVALGAQYALSVREDTALHRELKGYAYGTPGENGMGGLIGKAMSLDAQSKPAPSLAFGSNPLVDVRF